MFFSLGGWEKARFRGKGGKMATKVMKGMLEIGKRNDSAMDVMVDIVLFAEGHPGAVLYAPEGVWESLIEEALIMAKGGHPLALRFLGALEKISFRALPGGGAWEVLEA